MGPRFAGNDEQIYVRDATGFVSSIGADQGDRQYVWLACGPSTKLAQEFTDPLPRNQSDLDRLTSGRRN